MLLNVSGKNRLRAFILARTLKNTKACKAIRTIMNTTSNDILTKFKIMIVDQGL